MLTQIFKSILIMSAVGSLLSVFWLILKPITQKFFSPRWQYYIWLTVLIVMILPVHFRVPNRVQNISTVIIEETKNITDEILQTDSQISDFQVLKQTENLQISKIDLSVNIFNYLAIVWLLGVIVIFFTKIAKYILFLRAIHKNSEIDTSITDVPKCLNICMTDMLDAPLIVGIFKPTLFLPNTSLSKSDMNYILMHELIHHKRCDILYKWFAMTVQSIHWFNPFVYIVSRQIDIECEVSCDFAVTNKLSDSEKNNYMSMILDLLSHSKSSLRPLTTKMASSKKILKRRFVMIKNKKMTSKFMSVLSILVAVVILSTSVFASGILTDFATDDCIIEIYNGENKLFLKNDPFIYDGEYYLPLRDVLNGFDIWDITYNDGEITVKIPTENAKYRTNIFTIKIGTALIHYGNPSPDGFGVVMRCPPVLNNDTTFVTVDYFEDLMKSADLQGFRLNVIRPTEPENYYEKGEKVFIGTAEEQDNYTGKTVKRIIVDENGETIAVIPIENQIPENVEKKFQQAEKGAICQGFHKALYDEVFGCYDFYYDSLYESNLWFIDKADKYIAYINIVDIIKIPQTEFNKDYNMIITNTYTK